MEIDAAACDELNEWFSMMCSPSLRAYQRLRFVFRSDDAVAMKPDPPVRVTAGDKLVFSRGALPDVEPSEAPVNKGSGDAISMVMELPDTIAARLAMAWSLDQPPTACRFRLQIGDDRRLLSVSLQLRSEADVSKSRKVLETLLEDSSLTLAGLGDFSKLRESLGIEAKGTSLRARANVSAREAKALKNRLAVLSHRRQSTAGVSSGEL